MQFLEVPLTPWETCLNVYGSTGALDSPKSVGKLFILEYIRSAVPLQNIFQMVSSSTYRYTGLLYQICC